MVNQSNLIKNEKENSNLVRLKIKKRFLEKKAKITFFGFF